MEISKDLIAFGGASSAMTSPRGARNLDACLNAVSISAELQGRGAAKRAATHPGPCHFRVVSREPPAGVKPIQLSRNRIATRLRLAGLFQQQIPLNKSCKWNQLIV